MVNGNKRPVKKFQAGGVSAAVWQNSIEGKNGQAMNVYSVTLDRRYKDGDGNWQSSSSLRLNDVPKAALVLGQAYAYIATNGEHAADEEGEHE